MQVQVQVQVQVKVKVKVKVRRDKRLPSLPTAPIVRQCDVFEKYATECSTGNPRSPRAVRAVPAPTSARHR